MKVPDIPARHIRDALKDYENASRCFGKSQKPRSPATVNRQKASIGSMFKYAHVQGYVTKNPAHSVAYRPENNNIVRWLDDDERTRLLAACEASE